MGNLKEGIIESVCGRGNTPAYGKNVKDNKIPIFRRKWVISKMGNPQPSSYL